MACARSANIVWASVRSERFTSNPGPLPELTPDAIRRIRESLDVSRAVFAHMIRVPVPGRWKAGSRAGPARRIPPPRSFSWRKNTPIRSNAWPRFSRQPRLIRTLGSSNSSQHCFGSTSIPTPATKPGANTPLGWIALPRTTSRD